MRVFIYYGVGEFANHPSQKQDSMSVYNRFIREFSELTFYYNNDPSMTLRAAAAAAAVI